jgi:hypothetical protein
LKFDSTVNNTGNLVNASIDMKSHDVKDFFPHLGKPQWAQTESAKPILGNERSA